MRTLNLSLLQIAACFILFSASAQTDSTQQRLSWVAVQSNTEQVLNAFDQNYVYPEIAKKMRATVEEKLSTKGYQEVSSHKELIKKLQADLREVSADDHISLHLANESSDRTSHLRPISKTKKDVEFSYLSNKTGNSKVGYLRVNTFSGGAQTKERITTAMHELSGSDSLIIDLTENGGGDPNLVAFLASYFLDDKTHLWSILDRYGDTVFSASSSAQKHRYQGNLCVLIAKKTYSAPEAFAYTLKHLNRACIVGEASSGGAHLVQMEMVNEYIDVRIPVARAYNQITKSNWEGVGVLPTIKAAPSRAKSAALDYLLSLDPK